DPDKEQDVGRPGSAPAGLENASVIGNSYLACRGHREGYAQEPPQVAEVGRGAARGGEGAERGPENDRGLRNVGEKMALRRGRHGRNGENQRSGQQADNGQGDSWKPARREHG